MGKCFKKLKRTNIEAMKSKELKKSHTLARKTVICPARKILKGKSRS